MIKGKWLLRLLVILMALTVVFTTMSFARTMEEMEKQDYMGITPGMLPMEKAYQTVTLSEGRLVTSPTDTSVSLDGAWQLAENGTQTQRLSGVWSDAISATVPGSIHTALMNAGVIQNPYYGLNFKAAYDKSYYSTWWYKKEFNYTKTGKKVMLEFDGICDRANIWLNGENISYHHGMFGGPYIDITDKVKTGNNIIIINILQAMPWQQTVVFNCSYGWHYAEIPPLGIWRSVNVREYNTVEFDSPFIVGASELGKMDLSLDIKSSSALSGVIKATVSPKNFVGSEYSFTYNVTSAGNTNVRLRFAVPNAKLWWPNGHGEQNLYNFEVTYEGTNGAYAYDKTYFGIRSLDMEPQPSGETEAGYSRTAVINGRKMFLKGANWCTIDALMRFSTEDYDRILSRAKQQGINFFRAWGGGLPETDEFYELCDKYGITIYQEFPCAWDSHKTQPYSVLEETIYLNTKRLRNHPSLILWGGGNEGSSPLSDTVLESLGKITYLNDGTRLFYRMDGPSGGIGFTHDHIHWGGQAPEYYLSLYHDMYINMTEYGLDSLPNYESIQKYAPQADINLWPIPSVGVIAYHTSVFNGMGMAAVGAKTPNGSGDIETYQHYASAFLEVKSLKDLILGTQMAQTMALKSTMENARTNWPNVTAMAYYKMNDVAPAGSWATVDWYGSPKIAHYFCQDAYAPLSAVGNVDRINTYDKSDKSLLIPIHMIDDADELNNLSWKAIVRAYDNKLSLIKTQEYSGSGSVNQNKYLGDFTLTAQQTNSTPLFVTIDTIKDGALHGRTYYFFNYEAAKNSLFELPRANVSYTVANNSFIITNNGDVPAVAVSFEDSAVSTTFVADDSYFWLNPGETKIVKCNTTNGVTGITAFNQKDITDVTVPVAPISPTVKTKSYNEITLEIPKSNDASVIGTYIYLNGERVKYISSNVAEYTVQNLQEYTDYNFTIAYYDKGGNLSPLSQAITAKTLADTEKPKIISRKIVSNTLIEIVFNKNVIKQTAELLSNYSLSGNATIVSATLKADGRTLEITTSSLISNRYTLNITGVQADTKYPNLIDATKIDLEKNLVVWFDFDNVNGKEFLNNVNSGSKGALVGGAVWADGRYGKAVSIDGNAGSMAVVQNIDFNTSDGAAISFWFNHTKASTGYEILMAKGNKVAGHFEIYSANGELKLYSPDLGDLLFNININNKLNEWHHLAVNLASGKMKVYLDGNLVNTLSFAGSLTRVSQDLAIGSLVEGNLAFNGLIDEARIYERELDLADIARLSGSSNEVPMTGISFDSGIYVVAPSSVSKLVLNFVPSNTTDDRTVIWNSSNTAVATVSGNGTVTAIKEGYTIIKAQTGNFTKKAVVYVRASKDIGLLANYKLDEGTGTTFKDFSQSTKDGNLTGSVTWADGKFGKSLRFGQVSGTTAIVPDTNINIGNAGTIAFWFKKENSAEMYEILMAKGTKGATGHFEIYTQSGILRMWGPEIGDHILDIDLNNYIGVWHHLAFVLKDGSLKVYVDGQLKKTEPVSGTMATTTANLAIGSLIDNGFPYKGGIDEVKIYNRALTADEITALSNSVAMTGLALEQDIYYASDKYTIKAFANSVPINTTQSVALIYEVADNTIATVDANGIISGIRQGKTTLTVKTADNQFVDTAKIVVRDVAVNNIITEGNYITGVSLTNIAFEPMDFDVIVSVYNGNKMTRATIKKVSLTGDENNLAVSISAIPRNAGEVVKVFIFADAFKLLQPMEVYTDI